MVALINAMQNHSSKRDFCIYPFFNIMHKILSTYQAAHYAE